MATANIQFWAGVWRTSGFSDRNVASAPVGLPVGRPASDGDTSVLITDLNFYVAGRGGTRSVTASLGGSSATVTVGAAGSAQNQGWVQSSHWRVNGGTTTFTLSPNGSFYYGRAQEGSGVVPDWSTGFLSGGYKWIQQPSAPRNVSATPSGTASGRIDLAWDTVADEGGNAVSGYHVFAENGAFIGHTTGRTYSVVGNVGSRHGYFVRARNYVSEYTNKDSQNSNVAYAIAPGVASQPRNVVAVPSPTLSGAIDITWDIPSMTNGPITGYRLYRDEVSLGYVVYGSAATKYTDQSLAVNSGHVYRLIARNGFSDTSNLDSPSSPNTSSVLAPGLPTAPTNLVTSTSPTAPGQIKLTWTAPTNTYGGNTRYNIIRTTASGAVGALATSTSTGYTDSGLQPNGTYTYTVQARNLWGDTLNPDQASPSSTSSTATSPAPPSAPRNLTGVASSTVAGLIQLSWTVPENTNGTITGYNIYYSTGVQIGTTNGTGVSYDATGLAPGTDYRFYVRARNTVADSSGTPGAASNTLTITALGDPDQVTGLSVASSVLVAGRLVLTWVAPSGTSTGYNVFNAVTGDRVGGSFGPSITFDFLPIGPIYSYRVRARNTVTDTAGTSGGPASVAASGTPGATTNQSISGSSISNQTNSALNGPAVVSALSTATEIKYLRYTADVASVAIPSATGTVSNGTNLNLNGTYSVTIPSAMSLSFTRSGTAIPAGTSVASGTAVNNTNVMFNGTYVVTAIDTNLKTVSYGKVNANVSSRASTGKITNATNTVFNVDNARLISVTDDTLKYSVVHANMPLSTVEGTATDRTNRDIYNGTYTINDIPTYNTFTYTSDESGASVSSASILAPFGNAERTDSAAVLRVLYRSGWLG